MNISTAQISVGMPVYNGELYLEAAIDAVLRQTFGDFALIISDNASTDRTEEICRDYASQDSRILYTRNDHNIGAAGNYNRVFRLARGPYFRWFNADDLCAPTLHERCLSLLDAEPEVVLCYGKTRIIDQDGQPLKDYDDNLNLQQERASERYRTFFDSHGLTNVIYGLMRRSSVAKTSLMGNGSYYHADIVFMAQLTLHGKFTEIPETLFYRRRHEQALSWDQNDETREREFWTASRTQLMLPTWKKNFALLKAMRTAPISSREKLLLLLIGLRRMWWSRKDLLKELAYELRRRSGKLD